MLWSFLNKTLQDTARDTVHGRVNIALSTFFDSAAADLVFKTIAAFGGCIRSSDQTPWTSWLRKDMQKAPRLVKKRYFLVSEEKGLEDDPRVFSLCNSMVCITIYESNGPDVMETVIGMKDTSYMNILTATELISLYPNLTLHYFRYVNLWRHGIEVENRWDVDQDVKGVCHIHSSHSFGRACGAECPLLWRRLSDVGGICRFTWRGSRKLGSLFRFSDNFKESNLRWRIDRICANKYCKTAGARGNI
ncbi:hypothetical protein C8J56DRAFT_881654 [Mycena floridula]|nr:hypothetical protein C8J56DRAFT_881654 [Mycena floridula]